MSINAIFMGMSLHLGQHDVPNKEYFQFCSDGDFHLQCCDKCDLLRYPPTTACPWCAEAKSRWKRVPGTGTVHSFTVVHHAIQPGLKDHTPYAVLIVDLDTQNGSPSPEEALRVVGNLTKKNGTLASAQEVSRIGIGTRVRMTFTSIAPGLALPQWTTDFDCV
ncbi:MAG: OB-fold domain-containing protein [Stagnimonas sp.]|jgi:uncharacterized OB-fold protein|nr:OB-fold domain-containing protein [Stagnimonas sp.]